MLDPSRRLFYPPLRMWETAQRRGVSSAQSTITFKRTQQQWPNLIEPCDMSREKRFQRYKLITQDQFAKCVGGDRSKLYKTTENELKQMKALNLRGALEYICVYMTLKNSQTMAQDEPIDQVIARMKTMKYFVSYVQQMWKDVQRAKNNSGQITPSSIPLPPPPENMEQVLTSIFDKVFSDGNSEEQPEQKPQWKQVNDTVLLHKGDWPDTYEMTTLVAMCKYCYVPFLFVPGDENKASLAQTYDNLDVSLL